MAQRISRKQLKHDEFLDAAADASVWVERHWADLLKWIACAILVIVGILGALAWTRHRREQAREVLADGLRQYTAATRGPQVDAAALEPALSRFAECEARGGAVGDLARFYRGSALYRLGRWDEAASALEPLATSRDVGTLQSTARLLLAEVYLAAGQLDRAVALLTQAAETPLVGMPTDQALLRLGEVHEHAGRASEARATWQRLVDNFPNSLAAQAARDRLGS